MLTEFNSIQFNFIVMKKKPSICNKQNTHYATNKGFHTE